MSALNVGKKACLMSVWWSNSLVFRCGASIISTEYVLTAAHCVDFVIDDMVLGFGVYNFIAEEPGQVAVLVNRNNIIIHPEWDDMTIENYIALIKLDEPITFTPLIQAVALPTQSQAFETFEGASGIASGWGYFSEEDVVEDGIEVQVGITSYVSHGCLGELPAGFTRVTSFLDFIENNSNIRIAP